MPPAAERGQLIGPSADIADLAVESGRLVACSRARIEASCRLVDASRTILDRMSSRYPARPKFAAMPANGATGEVCVGGVPPRSRHLDDLIVRSRALRAKGLRLRMISARCRGDSDMLRVELVTGQDEMRRLAVTIASTRDR